ncbi:maestro heat-like repeat-containing protein family member 7 [Strix aluco]|uniref:maestro heat-like repeat-containing protein family member 7 n=1 Tax=Strix aluco TaxID=111821 RepID=UPI003DA48081
MPLLPVGRVLSSLCPLPCQESNRLREVSIRLFKDMIKTAVGRNKKKMVKKVRSALLPLFFHMSDVVENVAKASRDTLSACGEFLGWRKLSFLAETWQTHRIGECLITHDRSRVDEYLLQSLPYLKDRQATLREVAITFIGLAVQRRRTLRREKLWQICDALLPLRKDSELYISSLAAETISVLTAERDHPECAEQGPPRPLPLPPGPHTRTQVIPRDHKARRGGGGGGNL